MEPLGSFPRVLNVLPREKIEGPPRDFLKANLRPHPRPDQRPKTLRAAGPKDFWTLVWPPPSPQILLKRKHNYERTQLNIMFGFGLKPPHTFEKFPIVSRFFPGCLPKPS